MPVLLADVLANLFMHVADVVAISFVVDVVAIDVSYCGRCYCHHLLLADVIAIFMCCYDCVADVIATVADGIAIMCPQIAGHTNIMIPSVLEIIKINIFFRPEEAMLGTGKSLSYL